MRNHDHIPEKTTRLANRTATLTLLSSFALLVGVVAVPTALRDTEDAVTRLAAASPISAAIGGAVMAYRARVQLRAARERDEATASVPAPGDEHGSGA